MEKGSEFSIVVAAIQNTEPGTLQRSLWKLAKEDDRNVQGGT